MSKIRCEFEFPINSSPHILYEYISTPSGLLEWFSDDVQTKGDVFTFVWGDSEESAKLVQKRKDKSVRFRWEEDQDEEYYFEIRIEVDELTKDVSIIVVDFVESAEKEESKMYWKSLITDLKHLLGAV